MNAALAAIYGTGLNKTASDTEIDLSQISAADYLELLQASEGEEKVADGELDFSQLSGRQLLELYAEAEENELAQAGEATIEKMAADGSLDYFDAAGRVQAHAYWDEMSKLASEEEGEWPDDIEVDLDAISGSDLEELIEAGYEFDNGESEKVASFKRVLGYTPKGKSTAGKAWNALKDAAGAKGFKKGRGISAKGKQTEDAGRKALSREGGSETMAALRKETGGKAVARGKGEQARGRKMSRRGAAATAALYGTGATAAGAAGYAAMKKRRDS